MLGLVLREDAAPSASTDADAVVHANNATRIAWLILNIWPSHLGLPLLIATVLLSPKIKRHSTLVNMCLTWMIVGISSSLLLYTGHQTGPEPPYALCLVQASLLYGQPGLTSVSAFALVYQVFYVVRAAFSEKDPEHNATTRKWILIILPYIAFFAFASWTAFTGLRDPAAVSRDRRFFYCSVKSSILTDSITAFSFLVLLVTSGLEIYIAVITFKHWKVLRSEEVTEDGGFDLNLLFRVGIFGTWIALGMGLSVLSVKAPESAIPDMALATMGSAVVLVFGTQRDVLRTWRGVFGRSQKNTEEERSKTPNSLIFSDPKRSTTKAKRSSSWVDKTTFDEVSSIYSGQSRNEEYPRTSLKELRKSLVQRDISQPTVRQDLTLSFPKFERIEFGLAV